MLLWESNAVTDLLGGEAQVVVRVMGSSCKYRCNFTLLLTIYCLLFSPVLNKPTSLWPRDWGLLFSDLLSLHWAPSLICFPLQSRSAWLTDHFIWNPSPGPKLSPELPMWLKSELPVLLCWGSAGSVLSPVPTSTLGISGGSHKVFYWSFDSNTFWLLLINVNMK